MPGLLVTSLKLNNLDDVKERLRKDGLLTDDVLSVLMEAETIYGKFKKMEADQINLLESARRISILVWDTINDTINVHQLRDEISTIVRVDNAIPSRNDFVRMQDLLARFLHKVRVDGSVSQNDELVRDVIRFMSDADLLNDYRE